MALKKTFILLLISLSCFGSDIEARLQKVKAELYELKENDYKPYNEKEFLKLSKEMLIHAQNEQLSIDSRSDAYLASGAYLAIIPLKIIRSANIFKFSKALKYFKTAFSYLKLSIDFNPINELAIILHGKLVYQGFKMKSLVEKKTGIDLDNEKELAILEMQRIPNAKDSDRNKYYKKLLAL